MSTYVTISAKVMGIGVVLWQHRKDMVVGTVVAVLPVKSTMRRAANGVRLAVCACGTLFQAHTHAKVQHKDL